MPSFESTSADRFLRIGGVSVDLHRDCLTVYGKPTRLRPQSVRVLRILMENRDELVSRERLLREIWGDRIVTDDSLAQCLVGIRRALSDFDRKLILTVPGRGYLFQSHLLGGEMRRRPARKSFALRIGLAACAVALVIFAVIISPSSRPALRAVKPSVAVLPFADMTVSQDQRFLAEGLSEEILNQLATSSDLKVLARTTSFALGEQLADIESTAAELALTHIVVGSIRQGRDRLRISVQLVDMADSSNVWAQTYDRPLGDILDVQSNIASSVADALQVTLHIRNEPASGSNPFSHALVIQARSQLRLLDSASNAQAQQLLDKALQIEPGNVAALVTMAQAALQDRRAGGADPFHAAWQRSIEFTNRALELNPDHAVAIAQRGWAELYFYQDFPAAARSFERAMNIDPIHPEVMRLASNAMLVFDRAEIGMQLGQYSVDRDPLCVLCHVFLVLTARVSGHLDLAEDTARQLLVIRPEYPAAYDLLGDVLLARGDPAGALAAFERPGEDYGITLEGRAVANFRLGRMEAFDKLRQQLIGSPYAERHPAAVARVEAVAGNIDQAFFWLDKHLAQPRWIRGASYHHPSFDNLRGDPRWQEYRHRFGLSSEQLARIDFSPSLPF